MSDPQHHHSEDDEYYSVDATWFVLILMAWLALCLFLPLIVSDPDSTFGWAAWFLPSSRILYNSNLPQNSVKVRSSSPPVEELQDATPEKSEPEFVKITVQGPSQPEDVLIDAPVLEKPRTFAYFVTPQKPREGAATERSKLLNVHGVKIFAPNGPGFFVPPVASR
ncbi:MAG: hypothetical protein ACKVI4_13950 [Actinomycetales bacterium]|tara:strand:+ start:1534 stop:2031 length:498 start_codon:yes stop_codon:yes gene_type:complete